MSIIRASTRNGRKTSSWPSTAGHTCTPTPTSRYGSTISRVSPTTAPQGEQHRTWFTYALDLLRHLIKQRSIASDDDKIAILLYGTVRTCCRRCRHTTLYSARHATPTTLPTSSCGRTCSTQTSTSSSASTQSWKVRRRCCVYLYKYVYAQICSNLNSTSDAAPPQRLRTCTKRCGQPPSCSDVRCPAWSPLHTWLHTWLHTHPFPIYQKSSFCAEARGKKVKRELWLMTNQAHPEASADDADEAAYEHAHRQSGSCRKKHTTGSGWCCEPGTWSRAASTSPSLRSALKLTVCHRSAVQQHRYCAEDNTRPLQILTCRFGRGWCCLCRNGWTRPPTSFPGQKMPRYWASFCGCWCVSVHAVVCVMPHQQQHPARLVHHVHTHDDTHNHHSR